MPSVTAVEGGRAELPCDIVITGKPSDRVSILLWYKDKSGAPIYTLDLRGKALPNGSHTTTEILDKRARFQMTTQPAILLIEPIQPDDAGEYRCRVDFDRTRTRNKLVRLNVIEPPKYVEIIDDAGNKVGDTVNLREGAILSLTCQTDSGSPLPTLIWRKNSVIERGTYDVTPEGLVKSSLFMVAISRQDIHADVTCQASNNNMTLPVSKTVKLDLTLKPLSVQIIPGDEPLSANKAQEVQCQTYGSRPPPSVSWWKGSKRLPHTREFTSDDKNVTTSLLSLIPTEEDHGKFLMCRSDNPAIFGSILEDIWKMDVHFPPTASLALGSSLKHDNLKEGDDVYFECSIRANPRVYKVDWKFKGAYLNHNISMGVIVSNQSLVLQKIRRTSAGAYTCVARNTEGDGESNSVYLKLRYSPYCKHGQKSTYGVAKHETVAVACEISANPKMMFFKWALNATKNLLDPLQVKVSSENGKSVAMYTVRSDVDYGNLLCWAGNEIGEQREPCTFSIMPAGPPDPVHNCSIHNETESAMIVECSDGFDGGIWQTFVIEVFNVDNNQMEFNLSNTRPEFHVEGLTPGRGYLVYVYSLNAKGRSGSVTMAAHTLRVAERRTDTGAFLPITPVLGILCGVVATLVLAGIVVIIIVKNRNVAIKKQNEKSDYEIAAESTSLEINKQLEADQVEKDPDLIANDCTELNNVGARSTKREPPLVDKTTLSSYVTHNNYESLHNIWNHTDTNSTDHDISGSETKLFNADIAKEPVCRSIGLKKYGATAYASAKGVCCLEAESSAPDSPLMDGQRESVV